MNGKIVKGIAGFYYVDVPNVGLIECKARGIFRNKNVKPLIGDNVIIDIIEGEENKGNIIEILERKNELIRPAVANIDQAIIVFSVNNPKPNLNLLDKFLIMTEMKNIKAIICFNKIDTLDVDETEKISEIYNQTGYPVFLTSANKKIGTEELSSTLRNATTVFAGPSGVGKSSLLNIVQSVVNLETGEISKKIKRGKHTTRHAELICIEENSYVVDTPGFSSLYFNDLEADDIKYYFKEFRQYEDSCRFHGCNHINEPDCAVKSALENNKISQSRYNNYRMFYDEIKDIKRKW